MNEAQEGIAISEKDMSTEVVISEDILMRVSTETKQRSIDKSGEFFIFILNNGKEQIEVRVGSGHSSGVVFSPEEAINVLRPYINNGYKVIADYHCHPPKSVRAYKKVGIPPEYAFSPSNSDLFSDVPDRLKKEFSQNKYPHLIGVYLPETNKVCINGFQYDREPLNEEVEDIQFDDPFLTKQEPDELGIQLHISYNKPNILKDKGIIREIQVRPDSNKDIPSVTLNTPIK